MSKIKDVVYLSDIADEIDEVYHNGFKHGGTTHIPALDERFKWLKGNVIVFGGIMNHGKSTFLNQLMILKAKKEDMKFAIFTPESNPASYYYADLMRMYLGKSVVNGYGNKADLVELRKAKEFINKHFFYLYPNDDTPTPDFINSKFIECIQQHKVDGCVTDPFNQLDNDWASEGRTDLYISKYLTKEKKFATEHNIFKIIVTHPKTMHKEKGSGDYARPDVYDFYGGSMWGNKADDIIITHRPLKSSVPDDTTTEVTSIKIKKQPYCGVPGSVNFSFDNKIGRYLIEGVDVNEDVGYSQTDMNISNVLSKESNLQERKDFNQF